MMSTFTRRRWPRAGFGWLRVAVAWVMTSSLKRH
jgi:hypothetical protein